MIGWLVTALWFQLVSAVGRAALEHPALPILDADQFLDYLHGSRDVLEDVLDIPKKGVEHSIWNLEPNESPTTITAGREIVHLPDISLADVIDIWDRKPTFFAATIIGSSTAMAHGDNLWELTPRSNPEKFNTIFEEDGQRLILDKPCRATISFKVAGGGGVSNIARIFEKPSEHPTSLNMVVRATPLDAPIVSATFTTASSWTFQESEKGGVDFSTRAWWFNLKGRKMSLAMSFGKGQVNKGVEEGAVNTVGYMKDASDAGFAAFVKREREQRQLERAYLAQVQQSEYERAQKQEQEKDAKRQEQESAATASPDPASHRRGSNWRANLHLPSLNDKQQEGRASPETPDSYHTATVDTPDSSSSSMELNDFLQFGENEEEESSPLIPEGAARSNDSDEPVSSSSAVLVSSVSNSDDSAADASPSPVMVASRDASPCSVGSALPGEEHLFRGRKKKVSCVPCGGKKPPRISPELADEAAAAAAAAAASSSASARASAASVLPTARGRISDEPEDPWVVLTLKPDGVEAQ